jgi:hypothetical protein
MLVHHPLDDALGGGAEVIGCHRGEEIDLLISSFARMKHVHGTLIDLYVIGTAGSKILDDLKAWVARNDPRTARKRVAKEEALVVRQKQIIANLEAHRRAPRRLEREKQLLATMEASLAALHASPSLLRDQD